MRAVASLRRVRAARQFANAWPAAVVAIVAVTAALVAPDGLASGARTLFEAARLSILLAAVGVSVALAVVYSFARRSDQHEQSRVSTRLAAFVSRTPWPAAVAAIAAIAWALWYSLGRGNTLPRILSDELIHTRAARAFADSRALSTEYGPLTPVVHSSSFLLSGDDVTAYHLIQATNVTLMILAAFPVYLLARRALTPANALIATALSVALPWIVYARFVMTEGIFYPAFLLFVLALVRALERPTTLRQVVLFVAFAGAFGVRTQAAVLPAAVVAATALYGAACRNLTATMRAFWPTWVVYALAGCGVIVLAAMGTWNPLGAYDVLLTDSWQHPRGLTLWAGSNLTSLSLGLGLLALPAAILGAIGMLGGRSASREKAVAAAATASAWVLLLTVVVLAASPYGQGIVHERNLFYVAPLIVICALAWTTNDYPQSRAVIYLTVALVVAMMATMPRGVITSRSVDALSFKLWTQLDRESFQAWWQMLIAVVVATVAAALFRSRAALVLTVALASVGVAAASDYRTAVPRPLVSNYGWVDRRLAGDETNPHDERAMLLWMGCAVDGCSAVEQEGLERMSLNTEFFNSRIDRLGHVRAENSARGLPTEPLVVRSDGVITSKGVPVVTPFVVTDRRLELVGTRVAELRGREVGESAVPDAGLALWRVDGRVRLAEGRRTSPGG